ncbi:GTP-binding protein [Yoonia sp.]|uniref:GTP-binding protein n=1 Tax=Yoonia sp. TaxID=2212373 RepID=UPI0039C95546
MMLDIWIETQIAARGPDILRLKAVIWADSFDTPFVIHCVQHTIDLPIRLAPRLARIARAVSSAPTAICRERPCWTA